MRYTCSFDICGCPGTIVEPLMLLCLVQAGAATKLTSARNNNTGGTPFASNDGNFASAHFSARLPVPNSG